jgi:hypothetical protein
MVTEFVEPAVTVSDKGKITAPGGPGIGYSVNEQLIGKQTARHECVSIKTV